MKNLSFFQKIILILTWLFALLLVMAYIQVYIPVSFFPKLSLFSLLFPALVTINLLFLFYWLIQIKKYFFIPLLALLLNYNNINRLFQWQGKHSVDEGKSISIMSYNVRLFNDYWQIKRKAVDVDISNFFKDQYPDILLLQEFRPGKQTDFSQYPYQKLRLRGERKKMGVAIFSKFPIIASGGFDFKHTYNNALWVDLKINKDTVRVYNVHMQSHSFHPQNFDRVDKTSILHKISEVFRKQYHQAHMLAQNMNTVKHKIILGGDFNNTAFSSTYHILKQNRKDAFVEAGNGFGITWRYKFLPYRIDFLLIDPSFKIEEYKTYSNINFSDHKPIQTLIKIK